MEFGNYQHEGLKLLGHKTGVCSLIFGTLILSFWTLRKKDSKSKGVQDKRVNKSTTVNSEEQNDNEIGSIHDTDILTLNTDDSNTEIKRNEGIDVNQYVNRKENNEIEKTKSTKRNNKGLNKKLVMVVLPLLVLLIIGYFSLYYYPHNGTWQARVYLRKVTLKMDKGEGTFKIGSGRDYDAIIFEPNKKVTTIGIDGSSNKINVNKGVLIIELIDFYSSGLGKMNDVLHFKKK